MFQQTLDRVSDAAKFAAPIIVANSRHADLIDDQLEGAAATIILEPCARNTAPAIALAALWAKDGLILVMPSDHVIADVDAFHAAIASALPVVQAGWLVTFGITPDRPETGYGYIQVGGCLETGVHRVERFIEKPDREKAEALLNQGNHVWNGGIFLFRADVFLSALAEHAPQMLTAVRAAMDDARPVGSRILPNEAAFAASPSNSVDYAVMEKADRVAVVPVAMGWSDLGSWDALHDIGAKDDQGNVLSGNVRLGKGRGNLIKTDGIRISATGIDDLIIVARGTDVMILKRGQSQDAKAFSG
jgi:mannose-1-phosphate guanylyltransferase